MLAVSALWCLWHSVTDERLLLACCSHVAEWLVSASDGDSTLVTIPDGMFLASKS